jgi:hypothetical protein
MTGWNNKRTGKGIQEKETKRYRNGRKGVRDFNMKEEGRE